MNQDKIHLINKIFNNETIRTIWDKEKEKYYISVVDIVGIVSESKDRRKYWNKLKQRLKDEGNQTVTNCHQLKLKANDGKYRLTDVWKDGGITEQKEYAILTNEIYKEWSGMKAKEYKEFKGLKKENLRDNMSRIEELLTDLGEEAAKELAKEYKPIGLEANKKIARLGGNSAKVARDDIEKKLNKSVITSNNNLNYKYIIEKEKLENK